MLAELENAGEGWWPLAVGSFARSYERTHAAMTVSPEFSGEPFAYERGVVLGSGGVLGDLVARHTTGRRGDGESSSGYAASIFDGD